MIPQFGLRVSVLLDANGANTTAAAAVRAAARHLRLKNVPALVLGGTGPVGQRVARLLAREGAEVRVGSRQESRAAAVCATTSRPRSPEPVVEPVGTGHRPGRCRRRWRAERWSSRPAPPASCCCRRRCGQACPTLKVAIDLNAVPPLGIEGVEATDKGVEHDGVICYGAIGVGDTKMKIHKAAIARLFESNDQVLDAEEIYQLAQTFCTAPRFAPSRRRKRRAPSPSLALPARTALKRRLALRPAALQSPGAADAAQRFRQRERRRRVCCC